MTHNDLITKKLTISLNSNGTYSIQESTVPNMPVGNNFGQERLTELIKEGVKINFNGDLSSDAPKNMIFG